MIHTTEAKKTKPFSKGHRC